jgi:hypothetical protein
MSVMLTVSSKWNVGFQAQEQLRTVLLTEWKAAITKRNFTHGIYLVSSKVYNLVLLISSISSAIDSIWRCTNSAISCILI